MYACRDEIVALNIYRWISFLGVTHIVAFVYRFTVAWLNFDGLRKKLGVIAQWLGMIFYILSVLTPFGIEKMYQYSWGFYPQYGLVNKLFLVYFFIFFFLAFHNLIVAYGRAKLPTYKQRIRIVLVAFMIAFIASADYLPKLFNVEIYPIGFAATFIWIAIVAYGLIRYQIFNVKDVTRVAQDMRLATLGMMSASLSHEVKNPVYAMKGRAEIYLEKLNSKADLSLDETRQICDAVVKQSDRVLDIVRHFSQFARSGLDPRLKMEAIDLREVLKAIQPFVQHEITRSEVQLNIAFPPDMPKVQIDSRRMEEVLINLIINACQAMKGKAPHPKIEINVKVLNNEVQVYFRDNGPGFSTAQKEKLFEPFYTTKPGGMGLGLFISKQLIEEMGGDLRAETAPQGGALFSLLLKRVNSP